MCRYSFSLVSEAIQEYAKIEGVEFETKDLLILIPESCNFPDSIRSTRIESLKVNWTDFNLLY